jgi:AraC-like DNA-binding protein
MSKRIWRCAPSVAPPLQSSEHSSPPFETLRIAVSRHSCPLRVPSHVRRTSAGRRAYARCIQGFRRVAALLALLTVLVAQGAVAADLTRPYLSRRVAELAGMPLTDFLRQRQLAYAQHLLRTMPMSVKQIALASAFGTEWTFHRCFKAAFGVTPSSYRAQVTKCE